MDRARGPGVPTSRSRDRRAAPARRVLVVYEPSRGGEQALVHAADLARAPEVALTVVALAAQDTNPGCCVVGTPAYNAGIREDVMGELARACELLAAAGARAQFKLHVEGRDAPIE